MTLCYFIEKLKNNFPRSDYAFDDTFVVSGSVSVVQTRVQSYLGGAGPHWRALTHNGPGLTAIQRLIFWAESKHQGVANINFRYERIFEYIFIQKTIRTNI